MTSVPHKEGSASTPRLTARQWFFVLTSPAWLRWYVTILVLLAVWSVQYPTGALAGMLVKARQPWRPWTLGLDLRRPA